MLVLSALATLVALAVAGLSIAGVLARFVTQGVDQRLDAELALIATAVRDDGTIDTARLHRMQDMLDAGPEWRWRIEAPGGRFGSADMPAPAPIAGQIGGPPAPPPGPPDGHRPRPIEGHDPDGAPVHARTLTLDTPAGPVRLSAAAPRAVIARPVRGALVPLLLTLAVLGAVLAVAALVQIRLGLRPLRRLRDDVGAIRAGRAQAVATDQPAELRPLAEELNALVRDTDAALATARASAANLAHALKTPVATLALALRDDPRGAQVARIDTVIRHHLARARAGAAISARVATPLAPAIDALAGVIGRLRDARAIAVDTRIPDGISVVIDPADLDELAGNLIDNAVRHARTRVTVAATVEGRRVRLTVGDDGPGIAAADRARATAPGVRLDQRSDGHGFGLAIVRELAELHGGTLRLEDAAGGGLAASVTLPVAAA